jgi:3-phenylpropionate/trans-cinnamate dioxygenase ferredoxin subunit
MNSKINRWYKIAESVNELLLSGNRICVAEIAGKKICVAEFQQQWFGFAYKCPHASGIMADGYIDAVGNVVCPVHRFKFNLVNGRNTSGEGFYLKTYPVEVREDGVYVGLQ